MNEPVRKFREGFVLDEEPAKPASPAPTQDEAEEQDEQKDAWPMKVKLRKAIKISGGEYTNILTLREPTGRDINRHGNPTRMGPDFIFVIDERKMTNIIGALAGILTPDVEKMDSRDWNTVAYRLYRFFLPTLATDEA